MNKERVTTRIKVLTNKLGAFVSRMRTNFACNNLVRECLLTRTTAAHKEDNFTSVLLIFTNKFWEKNLICVRHVVLIILIMSR